MVGQLKVSDTCRCLVACKKRENTVKLPILPILCVISNVIVPNKGYFWHTWPAMSALQQLRKNWGWQNECGERPCSHSLSSWHVNRYVKGIKATPINLLYWWLVCDKDHKILVLMAHGGDQTGGLNMSFRNSCFLLLLKS